jgi:hypothetical protein
MKHRSPQRKDKARRMKNDALSDEGYVDNVTRQMPTRRDGQHRSIHPPLDQAAFSAIRLPNNYVISTCTSPHISAVLWSGHRYRLQSLYRRISLYLSILTLCERSLVTGFRLSISDALHNLDKKKRGEDPVLRGLQIFCARWRSLEHRSSPLQVQSGIHFLIKGI